MALGATSRQAKQGLGFGLGLRQQHIPYILQHWPELDWFEAITENYLDSGGQPRALLNQIAEHYPLALHGVSLSIGSTDDLDKVYLSKLKCLADDLEVALVSDHLCWTGCMQLNSHELLPVPLNETTLKHIVARVNQVQDLLNRQLVLENPSTYLSFVQSSMEEPEFLEALADRTGCGLLLDVNNVYVSAFNNEFDPLAYIQRFPLQHVVQIHLAGHQYCGDHIIDTHDGPVLDAVWQLYRMVCQERSISALLEWDAKIPDFASCQAELDKAKSYVNSALPCPEARRIEYRAA